MSRFIFLTRTPWNELPRIRHQLAKLLSDTGHKVVYFESLPFRKNLLSTQQVPSKITILQHQRLNRLSWFPLFHFANAFVVKQSLRSQVETLEVTKDDIVINFVFDYWFIRDLFPVNQIITVINDDFISSAKFGYTRPLLWALGRTCSISDRVLTVSVPLQNQLSCFCKPELFLPWADQPYQKPCPGNPRDILLYWGFINKRIDYQFVQHLADKLATDRSRIRLLFVGPIEVAVDDNVKSLQVRRNIDFLPPTKLHELPIDRILAGFIPYRGNVPDLDAITLPNKALQLLARGFPLLITGMPHFIRAPFVIRADLNTITDQIDYLLKHHEDLQPAIVEFVSRNAPGERLKQLLELSK